MSRSVITAWQQVKVDPVKATISLDSLEEINEYIELCKGGKLLRLSGVALQSQMTEKNAS